MKIFYHIVIPTIKQNSMHGGPGSEGSGKSYFNRVVRESLWENYIRAKTWMISWGENTSGIKRIKRTQSCKMRMLNTSTLVFKDKRHN